MTRRRWSSALHSWFPAKGDVVVKIDEIEPGLHVFAVLGELADVLGEILERLDVAARAAASDERAPGVDFPRSALRFRLGVDPFNDFAVAFAGGQLVFQGGEIEADEILEMLIERGVVGEFAVRAGDRGAAFIQ